MKLWLVTWCKDKIMEFASVVTDGDLNIIKEGPEFVVHISDADLGESNLTQDIMFSFNELKFQARWMSGVPKPTDKLGWLKSVALVRIKFRTGTQKFLISSEKTVPKHQLLETLSTWIWTSCEEVFISRILQQYHESFLKWMLHEYFRNASVNCRTSLQNCGRLNCKRACQENGPCLGW